MSKIAKEIDDIYYKWTEEKSLDDDDLGGGGVAERIAAVDEFLIDWIKDSIEEWIFNLTEVPNDPA